MPVVLALLHEIRDLIPLNERALTRTQMGKRKLTARYKNAELLFPDGIVRPVKNIQFGRFVGSVLPFPFHWITIAGEREISLTLGQGRKAELDAVQSQIIEYLRAQNRFDEWVAEGESPENFLRRVELAGSFPSLFEALHLNSKGAGLDVLS